MSQYVSWKHGDRPAEVQKVKPNTWTTLTFGDQSYIKPTISAAAVWAGYVNINKTDSSEFKLRLVRDPKGIADFTGINSYPSKFEPVSYMWMFQAKKNQPVALQIWHDGKTNMEVGTREFKLWIP